MPTPEPSSVLSKLKFQRRDMIRNSVLGSLGLGYFLKSEKAEAQSSRACETQDLKSSQSTLSIPAGDLFFWVHNAPNLNIATFAVYILFKQGPEDYVERIVLTDDVGNTIAARYFTAAQRDSQGFLPYLIFDQWALVNSRCFLYARWKSGKAKAIFRTVFTAEDMQRSKFVGRSLPKTLIEALAKPFANEFSSSFYIPRVLLDQSSCQASNLKYESCFFEHNVKAAFQKLGPKETFQLRVQFVHPDEANHYMRHFILCDPVGRILGITKREFQSKATNSVLIHNLTALEIKAWGLNPLQVASIADCPYVLLFWEDNKHAFREQILWLR